MQNETDPRPQIKAKRGDLVVVVRETCDVYLDGKERRRTYYHLGVVESVTLGGWVKAFRNAHGALHRSYEGYYRNTIIVPADKLAIPASAAIARIETLLDGEEIRTIEELRALVAPWMVEGQISTSLR